MDRSLTSAELSKVKPCGFFRGEGGETISYPFKMEIAIAPKIELLEFLKFYVVIED